MSNRLLSFGSILISLAVAAGTLAQSRLQNLGDLKLQLIAYHRSGAYERNVELVVTKAQKFVEKRAQRVKNPALVLDIDETSLSSWPQLAANDFGYIPAGSCDTLPAGPWGVRSWELSGRAEAIKPILGLFNAARALNVSVFVNLPTSGKRARRNRRKIVGQGYTIIANVGDQPSDLAGGYAERTLLLPDPLYRFRNFAEAPNWQAIDLIAFATELRFDRPLA